MGGGVVHASAARNRITLRTQLVVAFGAMAALPVVLLGIVQARSAAQNAAEIADRETLLASTSLAREVAYMLENRVNVTKTFAGEIGASGRIDIDAEGWRAQQYLDIFPGLYGAMILAMDGRSVGGVVVEPGGAHKPAVGLFYGDRPWVKDIQTGAAFSAELLRSRLSGRPAVSMAAPVFDRSGVRLGLVALGIDLERIQRALERVTEAAPGLQAVVLDSSGRAVAAAGPGRVTPLDDLRDVHLYDAPRANVERRLGSSETGQRRRGTVVPVESSVLRWWIVTTWPGQEVRERSLKALLTMAGFALVALLLGLASALLLARAIARPVSRLSGVIASIGGGDLRAGPPLPESWYPRELAELITSIELMLGQLRPLVTQLGNAVVAVAGVTGRLQHAAAQTLSDGSRQSDAAQQASGALVRIRDSIGHVASGTQSLAKTASQTTASIVDLDRQTDRIAGSVRALAETIEGAAAEGRQLDEQVNAVANSAAQLGENVAQTSMSLRLLTESIEQVGRSAERGRALARDALAAARLGQQAVDATVSSISAIRERFGAVGDAVLRLSRRSEAISDVVRVIDEVTRATRLLAINASIISQAAGEQGSGFGVIADGVRSLAAETAASTGTIAHLVASVQADIRQAVEAVYSGQETVAAGETRSKEAGTRLRVIIESAGESEQTAQHIAVSAGDQARRVAMLAAAVEEVRGATERISYAAQAQRQAQEDVALAIEKVRAVCGEVRSATEAQREDSRALTAGVSEVKQRLDVITRASEAQSRERNRIEDALGVFDTATRGSVEHGHNLTEAMDALAECLAQLQRNLGPFKV